MHEPAEKRGVKVRATLCVPRFSALGRARGKAARGFAFSGAVATAYITRRSGARVIATAVLDEAGAGEGICPREIPSFSQTRLSLRIAEKDLARKGEKKKDKLDSRLVTKERVRDSA